MSMGTINSGQQRGRAMLRAAGLGLVGVSLLCVVTCPIWGKWFALDSAVGSVLMWTWSIAWIPGLILYWVGRGHLGMMREVNFILWIVVLGSVWRDPRHIPVGREWVPVVGLVVALFWPGRRKKAAGA